METPRLDPAVVCGLIEERCEAARSQTYERRWERDAATWRAVTLALQEAADGRQPTTKRVEPPSWLDRLVRDRLETLAGQWPFNAAFEQVRALEQLGLVTLDADDTYVLAAVGGIGDRFTNSQATALRSDPDLIDKVVWRMFEVEGGGEVSLANVDKYRGDGMGWQAAFLELSADGTLPRDRVLASALSALNRDFSAYRAGWYRRLYDALDPTVEEAARHQELFCKLLRSNVPATVGFAVGRLRTLSKHGALDDHETLRSLGSAVVAGPKTAAITAVRLIDEIATRRPGLSQEVADVAAAALEHPHADVQTAAGKLLKKLDAEDRIEATAELLEPSVRADLLGRESPQNAPDDDQAVSVAPPPAQPSPVGDEDLLDRLAALLEDASDPIEVELVLAGLASLGQPDRLRSLAKRAAAIVKRGPREGVTQAWLRGQLAQLVLAATGGEAPPHISTPDPAVAFLLRRLGEVEATLRQRRPPQLLVATPDDAQGWLSAPALIERLHRRDEPPGEYDLIAALLRLHPDARPDALLAADRGELGLDPPLGDVVRYALGGPPPAAKRGRLGRRHQLSHQAAWIAASRARSPTSPDEWLASQGIDGAGRSQPIDATVTFQGRPFTWNDRGRTRQAISWRWGVEIAHANRSADDLEPTAVREGQYELLGSHDEEDLVGWLALIWPHDTEHFLVGTIHSVLAAAAFTEVSHDAVRVLNALADHPGRLGNLATTCLAAGLSASKTDQRTAAVDAVLQLSRTGRLDAQQLGAGLASFWGPATLTRLASSLRDVASEASETRNLVIDAAATALLTLDHTATGVHSLLDLLREELLRSGRPTPGVLQPWLEQFNGNSRSAKSAKVLLNAI